MAKTKKTDVETAEDEKAEAKLEAEEEKSEMKEEKKKEKTEIKEAKEGRKVKLAELMKKAKELEKGVEEVKAIKVEEVKKKKKEGEEAEGKETLVPMEDYLKASIHLGTRVITPDMRKYVYRRRADGLAVFNTALLDDKMREAGEFLARFAPEDVIVVCKREAGWKAVEKFSEVTGIKAFTKKYPAGALTNTNLENFMETDLVFICDPWLDKNALEDAGRIKIPVLGICDTNNFTKGVTQIIPGNNKSAKSIGIIMYLMARLYAEKRKLKIKVPSISEFIDEWDSLVIPK